MSKHIANYKPKDFAELLNISVKTLQRWDRDKILIAKRTPTDRRYYTYDQYLEFKGEVTIAFLYDSDVSYNKLIELSKSIGGVKIAKSIQNRNRSNRDSKTKD
jgi:predicted site-specific integrase-resolvase